MESHREHLQEITLAIEGMSCHSCSKTIESALKKVPGVETATVNFATGAAHVKCQDKVPGDALVSAVANAGYGARIKTAAGAMPSHDHHHGDSRNSFIILAICALLTLPFLLHMTWMLFSHHFMLSPFVQFILATLVQLIGGWTFYRASYYSLRSKTTNMDVLIALGTTAAYVLSVYAWIKGGGLPLYFETSAMIITLVLFGRWLEALSKEKASSAIGKLLAIQPNEAYVERGGIIRIVPLSEVVKGDILRVKAGERIPVDGEVISGESEVDTSVVTGESTPVVAREGKKVLAGTLNINGTLRIRAFGIGADTLLAGMIRMVELAQGSKPPVERLADKVSSIFVPLVILIAFLTFSLWWFFGYSLETALMNGVAVLVIACPCALGLATPIVIVVAGGRGAESGILFKEASSIERAHGLEVMFFDKTGTLTEGKPFLTDIVPSVGVEENSVLSVAASLEDHVEHPMAAAIVSEAKERGLILEDVTGFSAIAGKGAVGKIGGIDAGTGSFTFARENGIAFDGKEAAALENQGKSVVAVWKGGKLLGYMAASDKLRANAAQAIEKLKRLHIDSIMLTGDNQNTAEEIAREAGIGKFSAGLLPQEKLEAITHARKEGKTTGMIGDGINDAPALAASDVGFALGASTDVAMESASIALMRNDLMAVPASISLSKAAFRKIKQNLFFAFIYNIIGIPLAALGFLNPVFAAAAMAMSSLSVVLNALLLKRWRE